MKKVTNDSAVRTTTNIKYHLSITCKFYSILPSRLNAFLHVMASSIDLILFETKPIHIVSILYAKTVNRRCNKVTGLVHPGGLKTEQPRGNRRRLLSGFGRSMLKTIKQTACNAPPGMRFLLHMVRSLEPNLSAKQRCTDDALYFKYLSLRGIFALAPH